MAVIVTTCTTRTYELGGKTRRYLSDHLNREEPMSLRNFLHARNVNRLGAFVLGVLERRNAFGITFDDDPGSPRSRAYDRGRTLLG